jgi:diguanylate cyclase (GGDEF)-like protein/putative nucleotidyltransferase with HDIG domain
MLDMSRSIFFQAGRLHISLTTTSISTWYRTIDSDLVASKTLTYLCAGLIIAPLYVSALLILRHFLNNWYGPWGIVTIVPMIFIFPWIMVALRNPVQKRVDKNTYGWRFPYRETMLSLPTKMRNVLSVSELAEELLRPIPRALDASYVSLLLPHNGTFVSQFNNQLAGVNLPALELGEDSPIVKWLKENNGPLFAEVMDTAPQFKKLAQVESSAIQNSNIRLLVPMRNKDGVIAILALGPKQRGSYSSADIALLTKVSQELAATMANAQLYSATRDRVHTDDLTGLLSHGYFHRRVDEEISRCSRFGNIFSVLFLDIDLFKSYNDAFGHLAGDEILREISRHIKGSIRAIDVPCRYGGDEFAIILPESPLDDAYNIAERIRKRVETEMDSKGMAITCSIGVASWPTTGVTKEALITAADNALYLSKQTGRNRVTLAPAETSALEFDLGREQQILDAVNALAATVDAKDHGTYGHSKKAAEYAAQIASALGYSSDKIGILKAAALLHDIGKIRVPDNILLKTGPLTDSEWLAIREHPKFGVAILKHIKSLGPYLPIIQHHHEHFDGKGYPAGLKGEDIPMDARILAIADAYDAMTSPRPYRSKIHPQEALDEIVRCAGSYFDPEIVSVFAALWEPDHRTLAGSAAR